MEKKLKNGNSFCTNCGKSINAKIKNNILEKYKTHIIVISSIIVVVIIMIFIASLIKIEPVEAEIIDDQLTQENKTEEDKVEEPEENNQPEEVNLLEEIYNKHPDLREKEGFVCYNDNEYWLLDKDGKKIYFYDMESFEKALEQYKTQETAEADQNSNELDASNSDNSDNSYDNNYYDEEEEKDNSVFIEEEQIKDKSESEIINLLQSKGLKAKVTKKTEEVPYVDKLAGKTISTIERQLGNSGYFYNKGDTVEIISTKYNAIPWSTEIEMSDFRIKYKDRICYVNYSGSYGTDRENYVCFKDNPDEFSDYDRDFIWLGGKGRGAKYYINGECLENTTGDFPSKYTFNNVDKVTFKIVAPYLLDMKTGIVIGKNVTVFEKTYNVSYLYNNCMRSGEVAFPIE